MINQNIYNKLKKRYGKVSSWTIWSQPIDNRPKSNMGSLDVFDDPDLLNKLNTRFVFVGLNGSGVHEGFYDPIKPWHNFHSDNPRGNDYKLRYALNATPFWGSYITDIIKDFEEVDSGKVATHINQNPEFIKENIDIFMDELRLLGGKPVIIALGNASFKLLKKHLAGDYNIYKIKHYAAYISKENYRKELLETLSHLDNIL